MAYPLSVYPIGNWVFGSLVPFIGTALVGLTGNLYSGLIYPISAALLTLVIGGIYLKESHQHKLGEETHSR